MSPKPLASSLVLALVVAGCSSASAPTDAPSVAVAACASAADTAKVPLSDLGRGCYLGFQGGLYPDGANAPPAAHLAAGQAAAARIQPLDPNGQPSASGKIVLLSIGMSNATQEFCSDGRLPGSCAPYSFIGQATADPTVNHTTLALVNGAYGGRTTSMWTSPTAPDYDRIRDTWLRPLGLSERQVQAAWVKLANAQPRVSLPDTAADAYAMERQLGEVMRALKVRYPNLRQVFLTSRIYAGYATSALNPEPYAYETGFAVKWLIGAQIDQMAGGAADRRAGSLRYDTGEAPWIAWGPYPWAAGAQPRADGLSWAPSDFNPSDRTHPAQSARQKVGAMLLQFFETSPATRCWFLARC
ncbi:hypothetical protein J421_1992 [Gemmatirosa kalamazoonensis]|uniref:Lipolytic protein G-D-S-L family n=1 Tax=Gemmatirosa kalamazoonensis TaxID=861299 RepID=W0REI9_9BACT|nr:hypothetical protein [Gemmatirosa kalamazoonensis]AHG89529.1 hypothetical protein J421_1992 [Gemmatirosa kalamazoonensis]